VIAQMILQMVLVLGHERTLAALEQLLGFYVHFALMLPVVFLVDAHKQTLLTFVQFTAIGGRCGRQQAVLISIEQHVNAAAATASVTTTTAIACVQAHGTH
jgi:hypothetical protein